MIVHIHKAIRIRFSCLSWQIFTAFVLIGFVICFPVGKTQAESDFTIDPILRLETGQHTAMVRRISVDRQQRFLVSGSDDKTARVYDIKSGRLLKTLRIPVEGVEVGMINAVAISPDGDTVVVGGFTGGKYAGEISFYILGRNTGAMVKRIGVLPNVILHLTYSPDGRYLAAMLGSNGIKIYETKNYKEIASDDDYGDSSYWGSFDSSNRLVTTSKDGYIRLYDSNLKLIKKKRAQRGDKPYSTVFSPDGRQIAVAYYDSTNVDVLSADDLSLLFSADTKGMNNGYINTVAWSTDGRYLYAGGSYDVDGWNPILRWDRGGRGKFKEFNIATNTIMGIVPLDDGRIAVGAASSLIGLMGSEGEVIWKHEGGIADFRNQVVGPSAIRISHTGDVVQFGFKPWGKSPARFSLEDSELTLEPPEDRKLLKPITEAEGLNITDWINSYTPKLNGTRLELKGYELSRSLAIAPDGESFFLGADWTLRYYDRKGKEIWKVDTPGAAWAVNISGDGRLAVAGYGDGTLRWYRMKDGEELLALFPHPDGKHWVLWTQDGYYKASAGGEDLIGWHLNNGADKAPDFFGISRFRDQFYRPDVIAQVLKTLDVKKALKFADKRRKQKTITRNIRDILPPVVSILAPAADSKQKDTKLVLTYKAESTKGEIIEVEARVDGRPAKVLNHFPTYFNDRQSVVGPITIEIPPHNVIVDLIAKNENGSSEPAKYYVKWEGTPEWYKPELYVLAVGVTDYKNDTYDGLKYCAKDAEDFVKAIKKQEGGFYQKVFTRLRTDEEATWEEILDGLHWLKRETKSRDVAMVFLSGHGIKDSKSDAYQFLCYNTNPSLLYRTTVDDSQIKKFLGVVSGKIILFLDTCHSGKLMKGRKKGVNQPDMARLANELAEAESGIIVFASSTSTQTSKEDKKWENGAFTEALLEGIEGLADYTDDLYVSIAELEVWLADRVKKLAEQTPVTAKPEAVSDLKIIRIVQKD